MAPYLPLSERQARLPGRRRLHRMPPVVAYSHDQQSAKPSQTASS
jgi:hypothetical protein